MTISGVATLDRAASKDAALVRRAASGDAAAFDELLRSRLDRCYRLAYAILGNTDDARDATQEGAVSAWRQLPRLRDPAAFDAWLNRVVANAARMGRRRRVRLREVPVEELGLEDAFEPKSPGLATDPVARVDESDVIGRAFARLREAERVVLVLHHLEERPVAEIARTLGVPSGTVKWRLHQARKALERAMEAEG